MAIGAPVGKKFLCAGGGTYRVPRMALEAEKRHCCIQKMIIHRTVGSVAIGAIFGDVGMLEHKGPLFFHMAFGTGFLHRVSLQEVFLGRTMRLMTVHTRHFFLAERMMRKEVVFHSDLGMARITHFRHLFAAHLLLGPLMELVTVKAAHIIKCMYAGVPVSEAGS